MTTLTIELPTDLVAHLEQKAAETGQSLDTLVASALADRFAPPNASVPEGRIRLRPVRLGGWAVDATFRREEIYGDDAR